MSDAPRRRSFVVRRLILVWLRLSGSLWFLPIAIVIGVAALAIALIAASDSFGQQVLARFPRLFGADADSSRSMLATIASSIITVEAVTFSITVLAVTQASMQYTPRILRNFLRDRTSQVTLGVLVGVFLYCLIVIRTIRTGGAAGRYVPSIAVLGAFVLAGIAIAALMYFIHHITSTLEAGSIIAQVSAETVTAIRERFPATYRAGSDAVPSAQAPQSACTSTSWHPIPAQRSGYIQQVEQDDLFRLAVDRTRLIRMEVGVGDFVSQGAPLISTAGDAADEGLAEQVQKLYTIRPYRTVHQDPAFGIRQMVDIAVKALSPGVNDTTTAITCIDYLRPILIELGVRCHPRALRSHEGELRLIAKFRTFDELLRATIDEIRLNAAGNPRVLGRLLLVLRESADVAPGMPGRSDVILACAADVLRTARHSIAMADRLALEEEYALVERIARHA